MCGAIVSGWHWVLQDKVRPLSGREGGLGHERYIAIEHKDKVRPERAERAAIPVGGAPRGDYVQDKVRRGTRREGSLGCVRRDCFKLALGS